jgi:hypothetical protein
MQNVKWSMGSRPAICTFQFAFCILHFSVARVRLWLHRVRPVPAVLLVFSGLLAGRASGQVPDAASQPAPWQAPKADEVKKEVYAWLDGHKPDAALRAKADALWTAKPEQPSGVELLERVVRTFALADQDARRLLELCSSRRNPKGPPPQVWRADAKMPPLVANNLRLWYGRWLVQESLYDEALEQLAGMKPEDVADPATLLFCQAVASHRLLNQEPGLEAIGRLLANAEQGPKRYAAVARLMEDELKDLKEDSLDHIARRMQDIERRLDLGRAGPKVRSVEDGVIKSLDKLIEEMEKQQQQQSAAGGDNTQPQRPASDSFPMGGKGRGDVTKRNVGNKSGWGDLPPRQREEAMQQIGRQFPSHYRDVIEQYFRKLATEESK